MVNDEMLTTGGYFRFWADVSSTSRPVSTATPCASAVHWSRIGAPASKTNTLLSWVQALHSPWNVVEAWSLTLCLYQTGLTLRCATPPCELMYLMTASVSAFVSPGLAPA